MEVFHGDPDRSAAGGPAIYTGASFPERLVAALLSEPLVTGRSAARYAARGRARRSDERELIDKALGSTLNGVAQGLRNTG